MASSDMYDKFQQQFESIEEHLARLYGTVGDIDKFIRRSDENSTKVEREYNSNVKSSMGKAVEILGSVQRQQHDQIRETQRNRVSDGISKQQDKAFEMKYRNRLETQYEQEQKNEKDAKKARDSFYKQAKHFGNTFFKNMTGILDNQIKSWEKIMKESNLSKEQALELMKINKAALDRLNKDGGYIYSMSELQSSITQLRNAGMSDTEQLNKFVEFQTRQVKLFHNDASEGLKLIADSYKNITADQMRLMQGSIASLFNMPQFKYLNAERKKVVAGAAFDKDMLQAAKRSGLSDEQAVALGRQDTAAMAAFASIDLQDEAKKIQSGLYRAINGPLDSFFKEIQPYIYLLEKSGIQADQMALRDYLQKGGSASGILTKSLSGLASMDRSAMSKEEQASLVQAFSDMGISESFLNASIGNKERFATFESNLTAAQNATTISLDQATSEIKKLTDALGESQTWTEKISALLNNFMSNSFLTKLGIGKINAGAVASGLGNVLMMAANLKTMGVFGKVGGILKGGAGLAKGALSGGLNLGGRALSGGMSLGGKALSTLGNLPKGGIGKAGGGALAALIGIFSAIGSGMDVSRAMQTGDEERIKEAKRDQSMGIVSTGLAGIGTAIGTIGGPAGMLLGGILGSGVGMGLDFIDKKLGGVISEKLAPVLEPVANFFTFIGDDLLKTKDAFMEVWKLFTWENVKRLIDFDGTIKEIGDGINSIFDSIGNKITQVAKFISSADGIGEIASGAWKGVKGLFGSHKAGKDYIPFDEYPAFLHKGEMVLNAKEAGLYRKLWENAPRYETGADAIGFTTSEIEEHRERARRINALSSGVTFDLSDQFSKRIDNATNSVIDWGNKRNGMNASALKVFDDAFGSSAVQDWLRKNGYSIKIRSGLRNPDEQAYLVSKGYGASNSAHLQGKAVDYNIIQNGSSLRAFNAAGAGRTVNESTFSLYSMLGSLMAKASKSQIASGHSFDKKDPNHLEIRNQKTPSERQADKKDQTEATAEGVARGMEKLEKKKQDSSWLKHVKASNSQYARTSNTIKAYNQ